jgi:hypothetical protein
MNRFSFFLFAIIIASGDIASAQNTGGVLTGEDESKLYAQTKQVNQFFRRFNGEEDEKGERYYESDKPYRTLPLRKKYLPFLFDLENKNITTSLKKEFLEAVLESQKSEFLDFHAGNWFTEVNSTFKNGTKDQNVILFLKIQSERLGYEWVIDGVNSSSYQTLFNKDTTASKKFIHPMSHEIGFMNLRKAFVDNRTPESYTADEFSPDHLTLFLYELKKGNLKFESVQDVKFHFFQIKGWYFELSEFNRPGYNTGWLISNLMKVTPKESELLKNYLYGKQ